MNISISDSYSAEEKALIQTIVKAVFIARHENVDTFSPDRHFFISQSVEENPDFFINTSKFVSDNFSYKGVTMKDLGYAIFNDYVDPRDSYGAYEQLMSGIEINIAPVEQPVIAATTEIATPEPEHVIVDLKDITAGAEVDIINIPSGINIIEQN